MRLGVGFRRGVAKIAGERRTCCWRAQLQLLLLACLSPTLAQAAPATFETAHLDTGLFSFTFSRGGDQVVWGFDQDSGHVQLYFPGVVAVEHPPGWSASLQSPGWILWTVPTGPIYFDEPVTFRARSCLNAVANYSGDSGALGPYGAIFTDLYELPDYRPLPILGFQVFEYAGPALPILTIEKGDGEIVLRGFRVSDGFILEAADNLGPAAQWLQVPEKISVANFEFTLRIPAGASPRFFRLRHPCLP